VGEGEREREREKRRCWKDGGLGKKIFA